MKKVLLVICFVACSFCVACSKKGSADFSQKKIIRSMELRYATQFSVDYYEDDSVLVTIGDEKYLLVNKGTKLAQQNDFTIIHLPIDNVYLAASSAMDFYDCLGTLDTIKMTSTKIADWSLDEVVQRIKSGAIAYIGKYSAPDYEAIVSEGIDLAIESTMIYHSPAVKEKIEALGVPVLVERSSYEPHPLGRLEWIKLYGLLSGAEEKANEFFERETSRLYELGKALETKTVAFFYISSNGHAVVRKVGDYITKMITIAGGQYILDDGSGATENDNALSTMNMEMEKFYEVARDADIIIYNSTIDGEISTIEELIGKSHLLENFKAVREGNVWCTGKNMFQQTTGIIDMIVDMNKVVCGSVLGGSEEDETLTYLTHIK